MDDDLDPVTVPDFDAPCPEMLEYLPEENTPAPARTKPYKCSKCGQEIILLTNHYDNCFEKCTACERFTYHLIERGG